jgi:diaminopimelate decarboxylase
MPSLTKIEVPWKAGELPGDTPFYLYSEQRLHELFGFFEAFSSVSGKPVAHVHFALKSNNNPNVLAFFLSKGCGVDIVSQGELRLAQNAGFQGSQIVFSGVGKTQGELELAVKSQVALVNVESRGELERLKRISEALKQSVSIAFRVNPNVSPETHPYISTGLKDHKFGIDFDEAWDLYTQNKSHPYLSLKGMSLHIGSQMLDFAALESALEKSLDLARRLKNAGVALKILDVGGGVGVAYNRPLDAPPFEPYGRVLKRVSEEWRALQGPDAELYCELGRSLVAQAGWLVTRVIGTKQGSTKNFAIVDASMTELLRPALYGAQHPIEFWGSDPGESSQARPEIIYDVVGPVCESSDVLGAATPLPRLFEGDLLSIGVCGAYGAVMSSQYNARPLPSEWWLPLSGPPRLSRRLSASELP